MGTRPKWTVRLGIHCGCLGNSISRDLSDQIGLLCRFGDRLPTGQACLLLTGIESAADAEHRRKQKCKRRRDASVMRARTATPYGTRSPSVAATSGAFKVRKQDKSYHKDCRPNHPRKLRIQTFTLDETLTIDGQSKAL